VIIVDQMEVIGINGGRKMLKSTILIKKETIERLKGLRITSRETYDEILNRLMDYKGDTTN
jgi:hypothetical protein